MDVTDEKMDLHCYLIPVQAHHSLVEYAFTYRKYLVNKMFDYITALVNL